VVRRPARVTVRFLNAAGVIDRREFEGLWAVSVQHQIDHLEGRMFFDRLSRVKRDMILRRAKKAG
jgi:peptide deformylase